MLQKESELGDGAEGDKQNSALTFMDMPVVIAVKYIEGNGLESMGIDFYLGNAGVNTSAIELLETLINYIDDSRAQGGEDIPQIDLQLGVLCRQPAVGAADLLRLCPVPVNQLHHRLHLPDR